MLAAEASVGAVTSVELEVDAERVQEETPAGAPEAAAVSIDAKGGCLDARGGKSSALALNSGLPIQGCCV